MAARRIDGVRIERVADEILAVKLGTAEAHALNQSAAIVFDMCDGTASKSEIAAEIQRRTGLPADEGIVDLALGELGDAGLVVLDRSEPSVAGTRRSLMRRLSLFYCGIRGDAPDRRDHFGASSERPGGPGLRRLLQPLLRLPAQLRVPALVQLPPPALVRVPPPLRLPRPLPRLLLSPNQAFQNPAGIYVTGRFSQPMHLVLQQSGPHRPANAEWRARSPGPAIRPRHPRWSPF